MPSPLVLIGTPRGLNLEGQLTGVAGDLLRPYISEKGLIYWTVSVLWFAGNRRSDTLAMK